MTTFITSGGSHGYQVLLNIEADETLLHSPLKSVHKIIDNRLLLAHMIKVFLYDDFLGLFGICLKQLIKQNSGNPSSQNMCGGNGLND